MSPSVWIVKSPLSSKNGSIATLALRIAKRTTRPSAALNLMATTVVPTEMVWSTARPVVLICSSTSPPRVATPASPASTVTRSEPAMPSGAKTKPPCPLVNFTPSTSTLTSDAAMRTARGAGIVSCGLGSTRVICSMAKLPCRRNGVVTGALAPLKATLKSSRPDRRR